VTRNGDVSGGRPAERELLETVAAELRGRGYRAYVDPDGTDYFDLAVIRGEEVGLVEGKVGRPAEVLGQALRRRPWADWVAVVVPSEVTARRLVARTAGVRARAVGVWAAGGGRARELRSAVPFSSGLGADPFGATRGLLRKHLVALGTGEIPPAVRWSGVLAAVGRASAGRGFAEWRLDELPADSP
jgi:hypothetical protein